MKDAVDERLCLKENESYLRWLLINSLTECGNSVSIYVPTLEAERDQL
jgi:hypothetical protein